MQGSGVITSERPDHGWAHISREVTNTIFDELWSDINALQACALVCRAWTPRCQQNLLYDVRICGQQRMNDFLHAIMSFSERVRSFFTVVRLVGPLNDHPGNTTITWTQFGFILDNLPSVQHVVFRNITLDASGGPPEQPNSFTQRAIDTLIFVDIAESSNQSATPDALILFLCLFHSIRYLSIMRGALDDSAFWNTIPNGDHQGIADRGVPFPPHLRIQELRLAGSPGELNILSFLRHCGAAQNLHRLCVKLFSQDGLIELARFLRDGPEQLEHLRIHLVFHLTEYISYGFPELDLDVHRFKSLRTLVLGGGIRTWVTEASYESCNAMLSLVELFAGAPALEEVEIGVTVRWNLPDGLSVAHLETLKDTPERATPDWALEMVYSVPWGRLEALQEYASLQCVVVVVYKSCDDWYSPEDYTLPIVNLLQWPENRQDIELLTDYSFWEDVDEADMENILEI